MNDIRMCSPGEVPLRFYVDRRNWSRGTQNRPSLLCNGAEAQCCLGFYMEQLVGVQKENLRGVGGPAACENVTDEQKANPAYKVLVLPGRYTSSLAAAAMEINDDEEMDERRRERLLHFLFASQGIEAVFIN